MLNQMIRALADDETNAMFDKYMKESGSTDLNRFLDSSNKLADLTSYITNYKELNAEYVKLMNMVAPTQWGQFTEKLCDGYIASHVKYQDGATEQINHILHELDAEQVNGKSMLNVIQTMVKNDEAGENGILQTYGEEIKQLESMSEDKRAETIKKIKEKKKFRSSIKLYHGTSAANYKKILHEGQLKMTDYSEVNTNNVYINDLLHSETGYLFTSDSMDIPIAMSLIGAHEKAFKKSKKSQKAKRIGYGVVFEIDSTGYDLLLYKGDEILICGDVDIKNTIPHFFKMLWTGKIVETTYDDFVKDGVFE
jgi:hypothetical protein